MSKILYRGISVVVPDGPALDRLIEAVDHSQSASRVLGRLPLDARTQLRRLFGAVYLAGLRDGIDRAIELGGHVQPQRTPLPTAAPAETRALRALTERLRRGELPVPRLSPTALELNRLLADPEFEAGALLAALKKEPALAQKVIGLASQLVAGAGGRPPRTLEDAVVRLGTRELARLLLAEVSRPLFAAPSASTAPLLEAVFRRSLACGLAAEHLALQLDGAYPAGYFLHGLLHDIGRAVLIPVVDALLQDQGADGFEVNELTAAMDELHGQFGAALLRRWRFGDSFIEVARFHHQPGEAPVHRRVVATVALAEAVASSVTGLTGASWEAPLPETHPALKLLGLSLAAVRGVEEQVEAALGGMVSTLRSWESLPGDLEAP